MTSLTSILKQLKRERNHQGARLKRLDHAISLLNGTSSSGERRPISAAGRARITAAQRARWATWRKAHKKG